jgi:hypothetical protein
MNSLSGSDKICHLLYGLHRFLAFWVSQTHSWGTTVQAAAGFPTATRNCNFENASFCLPDPPPACRTLKHAGASIASLPAISINVTDGAALEAEVAAHDPASSLTFIMLLPGSLRLPFRDRHMLS